MTNPTKTEKGAAAIRELAHDDAISAYVSGLKHKHGYALPADEARRIVDESMGTKTLTEILYKMRARVRSGCPSTTWTRPRS